MHVVPGQSIPVCIKSEKRIFSLKYVKWKCIIYVCGVTCEDPIDEVALHLFTEVSK